MTFFLFEFQLNRLVWKFETNLNFQWAGVYLLSYRPLMERQSVVIPSKQVSLKAGPAARKASNCNDR